MVAFPPNHDYGVLELLEHAKCKPVPGVVVVIPESHRKSATLTLRSEIFFAFLSFPPPGPMCELIVFENVQRRERRKSEQEEDRERHIFARKIAKEGLLPRGQRDAIVHRERMHFYRFGPIATDGRRRQISDPRGAATTGPKPVVHAAAFMRRNFYPPPSLSARCKMWKREKWQLLLGSGDCPSPLWT